MRTLLSTWLGFVLVSSVACTYQFPDPRDESEVYRCDTTDDCTDGFTCISGICLDEEKVGTEVLTIRGQVLTPANDVYTVIEGIELTAPIGAGGTYELEVPVADSSRVIVVYTRGGVSPGAALRTASILGDAGRLKSLASSGVVGADQLAAARITPLTTAAYGAVCAANGRSVPASRAQLVAAEQTMNEHFDDPQLLEAAAALNELLKDAQLRLPAGFATTLELACDAAAMRALVSQARGLALPPNDVITHGVDSLLADPNMAGRFRLQELPPAYLAGLKSRRGLVGYLDEYFSAGTSQYQPTYPDMLLSRSGAVSWSLQPDGRLRIQLAEPLEDGSWLTGPEIAAYYSDSTTQETILAAVGANEVFVPWALSALDVRLLAQGTAADWVVTERNYFLKLAGALADYGVVAGDVTSVQSDSRVWIRSDELQFQPWPVLEGSTWPVSMVAPLDEPSLDGPAGTPGMVTAQVTFGAGGLATARISSSTILTLTWAQDAAGVVTLQSTDGIMRQRIALWDRRSPEYGLLVWHQVNGSEVVTYRPTHVVDFASPSSSLVNALGEYWQSQINVAFYPPEAGELPLDALFGFELHPDGSAIRRMIMVDGGIYQWGTTNYFWRVEGSDVVMEEHRNSEGRSSTCTIPGPDPSCYVVRVRRWTPLSLDSGRLFVIESDRMSELYGMSWDGVNQQWLSNGTPVTREQLEQLTLVILPRISRYERLPIGN